MIGIVDILLVTLVAFATVEGYRRGLPVLVGVLAVFLIAGSLALTGVNQWLYLLLSFLIGFGTVLVVNLYVQRLQSPALDSSLGALGGLLAGVFLLLMVYGGGKSGAFPTNLTAALEASPLSDPIGSIASHNNIFARLLGSPSQDASPD